jgi:hypothetical protein
MRKARKQEGRANMGNSIKHCKGIGFFLLFMVFLSSCFAATAKEGVQSISFGNEGTYEVSSLVDSLSIVLGRPTDNEITASILSSKGTEVYLVWGTESGVYRYTSPRYTIEEDKPVVIVLDQLISGQKGYYRLFSRENGKGDFSSTPEYSFQMPRNEASSYSFVVQSDSHLLNKADPDLYLLSMQAMHSLDPDFIFDLGDTFINDQDKAPKEVANDSSSMSAEALAAIARQQLPYFDVVTRNAPLFLVLGNHEGEMGAYFDGTDQNLAIQSTLARTTYYPNPVPNDFYTGNTESEQYCENPQNYYAFTWGDALYVTLDPYRYTTELGSEGWNWTLGKEQYDWFRTTLENSTATYKFVFSHHANGNMRGGAQVAELYEWGGYDKNGSYLFDEKRPGWGKPIQQVMEDEGVTIFFQGHDHVFSREMVGSVVYQTLPKPAEKVADNQSNYDAYPNGDTLLNSGFLKVSVSKENVKVEYNRMYYVSTESQKDNTGMTYSYTVEPDHEVTVLVDHTDNLASYGQSRKSFGESSAKKQPLGKKKSESNL